MELLNDNWFEIVLRIPDFNDILSLKSVCKRLNKIINNNKINIMKNISHYIIYERMIKSSRFTKTFSYDIPSNCNGSMRTFEKVIHLYMYKHEDTSLRINSYFLLSDQEVKREYYLTCNDGSKFKLIENFV